MRTVVSNKHGGENERDILGTMDWNRMSQLPGHMIPRFEFIRHFLLLQFCYICFDTKDTLIEICTNILQI